MRLILRLPFLVVGKYFVICILGGGSLFAIHNESEVYNPRTDRWAPIPPMSIRRSRAGVASLGKVLYVIGG